VINLESVSKSYRKDGFDTLALDAVSLEIEEGEFVVLRGPSGSGKTTLLVLIAGMLRPTKGEIIINQKNLAEMNAEQKARFRADNIGFVFQMFHLVPYLNVIENVMLAETVQESDSKKAESLLSSLGLINMLLSYPAELSAGEKQRTAIARALINQPKILLADEPTGNLDPDNAQMVLSYFADFQRQGGTLVVASHNDAADQFADRIINLSGGQLVNSVQETSA